MDEISDIEIGPLTESKYIQCYRVHFKQNGMARAWDCMRQHDSVAVMLYNVTKQSLIVVTQFRPAVYMSSNREVWKDSPVFKDGSLNMKSDTATPGGPAEPSPAPSYGPGMGGITYELCAGIVDKNVPLEQIAKEEVLEETGYDVPLESLQRITTFWSNIGTAGSQQTVFYCQVNETMHVGKGGGNAKEGELIDVVHLPVKQVEEFVYDISKKKSMGLAFAFMWFAKNILPGIQ
jgi:UDP-sugar diphosphatase